MDVGQSMECLDTPGGHICEEEFVAMVQAGRLQDSHTDAGFLHHVAQGREWNHHAARAAQGDVKHEHVRVT